MEAGRVVDGTLSGNVDALSRGEGLSWEVAEDVGCNASNLTERGEEWDKCRLLSGSGKDKAMDGRGQEE